MREGPPSKVCYLLSLHELSFVSFHMTELCTTYTKCFHLKLIVFLLISYMEVDALDGDLLIHQDSQFSLFDILMQNAMLCRTCCCGWAKMLTKHCVLALDKHRSLIKEQRNPTWFFHVHWYWFCSLRNAKSKHNICLSAYISEITNGRSRLWLPRDSSWICIYNSVLVLSIS